MDEPFRIAGTPAAKLYVYLISAFGCGVVGAVVAMNLLRIQPAAAFSINWTAYALFIVVIGGFGTIEGPIIDTVIYFTLLQDLGQYGATYLLLLGVIAVVMATRAPPRHLGLHRSALGYSPVPGATSAGIGRAAEAGEPGGRRHVRAGGRAELSGPCRT